MTGRLHEPDALPVTSMRARCTEGNKKILISTRKKSPNDLILSSSDTGLQKEGALQPFMPGLSSPVTITQTSIQL